MLRWKSGMSTKFASPERLPREKVLKQAETVATSDLILEAVNQCADAVAVLNAHRQIVFCNHALLALASLDEPEAAVGRRPGELLECIHAGANGGCGTSDFCRVCGAVEAILKGQQGSSNSREVRITRTLNGKQEPLDLMISVSPSAAGKEFVICSLVDISHEKRRRALERIFLHDVLNTASGLSGIAGLVAELVPPGDQTDELVDLLKDTTQDLIAGIEAQRQLAEAEDGELAVEVSEFGSLALLRDLALRFRRSAEAKLQPIDIEPGCQDVPMATSRPLLRRVLENLLKNAVEASAQREIVEVACREDGAEVEFRVHNRAAMPAEVRLQIFQRNFSTKGCGRGLGVYSVKLLTERYLGGSVRFHSADGEGTTFWVRCPKRLPAAGG
jgi:signal transduction histidine kinase